MCQFRKTHPGPALTRLCFFFRGRGLKLRTFLRDLSSSVAWVGWEGRVRGLKLCQDKNLTNPPKRFCQFVLTTFPPPPHISCSLTGNFFRRPPFPFILFWRNQENKKVYYLLRRLIPPPHPRSPSPTPVINDEVKQIVKRFALHDKL